MVSVQVCIFEDNVTPLAPTHLWSNRGGLGWTQGPPDFVPEECVQHIQASSVDLGHTRDNVLAISLVHSKRSQITPPPP